MARIDIFDQRFYQAGDGKYYPSVTHVLGYFPKGVHFEQWLKDVGNNADFIRDRAAEIGTNVHDACENLALGRTVNHEGYKLEEWLMILKFQDFWQKMKPKALHVELNCVNDALRVGGTMDLICEIDGETWLIDYKTSNNVQITHFIQCAVYSKMSPVKIDRIGVLHLKAKTRTSPAGKMQGKGWKVEEPKHSVEDLLKIWNHTRELFDFQNPDPKPKVLSYPTEIKL